MISFAERAEKNNWSDGGCYWIPAGGSRNEFVKRLGNFAEALANVRLKSEELEDVNAVVSMIRRKLRSLHRNWLVCLDNADDPDVNGIIGDLCGVAHPGFRNGWVLVTSRQSAVPMWSGMGAEQKLKLMALSKEYAMLVLLRWKMARLKTKVEDSEILVEVARLCVEDDAEYQSLAELATNLGGLSLALAQAGSYIYRNDDSFLAYVHCTNEFAKTRMLKNYSERSKTVGLRPKSSAVCGRHGR